MNNVLKISLGFVAGAVLTCLLVAVAGLVFFNSTAIAVLRDVQAQPGEAARVGAEIADYSVPAGYSSALASQVADLELVGYNSASGHSHLFLLQLPTFISVNQAELERQLQSSTEGQGNGTVSRMELVEEQPVTIRGQSCLLVVREGLNGEGLTIRSASAMFEGKDGQALVNFSGLASEWDSGLVADFISSMR
jgi:hypothetical protein